MVSEPMPARTRFFAISFARAFTVTRRMFADRILVIVRLGLVFLVIFLLFLSLNSPEPDLPVIQRDLI